MGRLTPQFKSQASPSVLDVWSEPERTLSFFKGRVAFYGILRAANIGAGDEVLLPGFTCVVVPAAVLYTGALPVFYDINPRQLNGDPDAAISKINEHTRAVIVQHTFGVPGELGALPEICRARGILLIEDCAHALGASLFAQQVGTLGDAAFASLQWSKPITTGLGGLARINTAGLWEGLREFHDMECSSPTWREETFLTLASIAHAKFFRPSLFWGAQNVYRRLGRMGIVKGSSDRCELSSPERPAVYAKKYGARRSARLRAVLQTLPETVAHRRRIAHFYCQRLQQWDIALQEEPKGAFSVPLRVPIRVRQRERLLEEARRSRIELGDWFNAPLHPGEVVQEAFGYESGTCPHAERAASGLVNLPTHPGVDRKAAFRILDFLSERREFLVKSSGTYGDQP